MDISLVRQAALFASAMLVLSTYVGHQMKWSDSNKLSYNILNAVGFGDIGVHCISSFSNRICSPRVRVGRD